MGNYFIKMKFALIALLGFANATTLKQLSVENKECCPMTGMGCGMPVMQPSCGCGCNGGCGGGSSGGSGGAAEKAAEKVEKATEKMKDDATKRESDKKNAENVE